MLNIEISNEQDAIRIDERYEALIQCAAQATLASVRFSHGATVDVLLTDNEGIQSFNLEYRGKDAPTDVLSFPLLHYVAPLQPLYGEADSDGAGGLLLGDLVISLERVKEQAEAYGHSFDRELGFMVVHGMLHLLGFDHESGVEEKEMFALQERILGELRLAREGG